MTYAKQLFGITVISLSLAIGFTGCESPAEESGTGTLSVLLTDAPFPADLVAEANVTIDSLEVRQKGGGEGGPYITLSSSPQSFNLLDLSNGITTGLAELDIATGSYDLLRLYVGEASIVMNDGTTYDLTVPSGAQTGIKIFVKPDIAIVAGVTTELLLDFDVSRSFVMQGTLDSPTGFLFKPVIRGVNESTTGGIIGIVSDTASVALRDIEVWAELDTVVSTAFTDTTGFYGLVGLPAATYAVKAYAAGYDTVTVSAVVVTATANTTVDIVLTTP